MFSIKKASIEMFSIMERGTAQTGHYLNQHHQQNEESRNDILKTGNFQPRFYSSELQF